MRAVAPFPDLFGLISLMGVAQGLFRALALLSRPFWLTRFFFGVK